MIQRFEIPGRLPGMNEYVNANRTNPRAGARMKRDAQDAICWCIRGAGLKKVAGRVDVAVTWVEKDMRRDKDNIRAGLKFILDALVSMGILPDDNWTWIGEISDRFVVNKSDPRVIVEISGE